MNPIKIKFNEPDPSPSVIGRHKNFSSFIGNYQKYYSPRGIRYFFRHDIKRLVFIIIIVLLLLILFLTEVEASKKYEKIFIGGSKEMLFGSSFVEKNSEQFYGTNENEGISEEFNTFL